jgi:2,4-dienoyl-CoA reductase-like NADH-dependent reductase (Old Yellow Enzyme family)
MGMPLDETIETFSYLLNEIDKLGLSYVVLARHSPMLDPTGRGTVHDVVDTYGKLVNREKTKLFVNSGYTPEEAQKVIADDKTADGVFFGFAWLTHPDLTKRIQYAKPLDNAPDFHGLYNHDGTVEGLKKGYTDYPAADYSDKIAA